MREREGRRTNEESSFRAVELQPHFKAIQVCLIENIKVIEMVTKCVNAHYIYDRLILG